MTHRMLNRVLLASACMLAAPATAADVKYDCVDGTKLTVTFSPPAVTPGSAVLHFTNSPEPITLPQSVSADGGRYAAGDIEFWITGNQATLTRGSNVTTCYAT